MKTTFKKSAFGFSAVNAGQRNVSVEPELHALSTAGGFKLTAPVTKVLNIAPGDYVMFINNVAEIDAAIAAQTQEVVAFAEENGLELGSPELAIAMHKEFDMWAIAKGIALYNSRGVALTVKERLSSKDREAIVNANFDDLLDKAMASDNEELISSLSRDGVTRDEQVTILMSLIEGREVPKYQGSKTATTSGCTGAGLALNFTDTNVWNQLKYDMEAPTRVNRVFALDLEDVQTIVLNNGYEDVKVSIVVLGEYEDKAPIARGEKTEVEE